MPAKKVQRIADAAEMIVDGHAVLKDEMGHKIAIRNFLDNLHLMAA